MRGLVLALQMYVLATVQNDSLFWLRVLVIFVLGAFAYFAALHFDNQIMKFLSWYAAYHNKLLEKRDKS